jgi:hypothetical protein
MSDRTADDEREAIVDFLLREARNWSASDDAEAQLRAEELRRVAYAIRLGEHLPA